MENALTPPIHTHSANTHTLLIVNVMGLSFCCGPAANMQWAELLCPDVCVVLMAAILYSVSLKPQEEDGDSSDIIRVCPSWPISAQTDDVISR